MLWVQVKGGVKFNNHGFKPYHYGNKVSSKSDKGYSQSLDYTNRWLSIHLLTNKNKAVEGCSETKNYLYYHYNLIVPLSFN